MKSEGIKLKKLGKLHLILIKTKLYLQIIRV